MTTPPPGLSARYELGPLLGRGGMADVYRAQDSVLGRPVAIKVLREVTDVERERFASEARILASLSHPAVVRVYDAGVDGSHPWLALELIEGRTLAERLRDGSTDSAELARWGSQLAAALAHAHAAGIVHRDVKPANVLVDDRGRARLTDFGIARLVSSGTRLTSTGHAIGTAAYLAPEQVRGGPTTGAADVYALGLVLLEALTGRRAYDGPPVEAALARLQHGPLIPTSLPAGWSGLLAAMTAAEPEERPAADVVARRLGVLAGRAPVEVASAPTTSAVPLAPAAPRATGPRLRRRSLVAAAAVALLGGAVALVQDPGGDEPAAAGEAEEPATPAAPRQRRTRSAPRPADPTPSQTSAAVPVAETADEPSTTRQPRPRRARRPSGSAHPGSRHDGPGPGPRPGPGPKPRPRPKGKGKGKDKPHGPGAGAHGPGGKGRKGGKGKGGKPGKGGKGGKGRH